MLYLRLVLNNILPIVIFNSINTTVFKILYYNMVIIKYNEKYFKNKMLNYYNLYIIYYYKDNYYLIK
jgi:hypothetical protein